MVIIDYSFATDNELEFAMGSWLLILREARANGGPHGALLTRVVEDVGKAFQAEADLRMQRRLDADLEELETITPERFNDDVPPE